MHSHGPKCLEGPVRGTPGWWQELGKKQEGKQPAALPRKKRSRRVGGKNQSRRCGSGIRQELVDKIRQEIEAGVYETQEKWEAALERLLEHLNPE